MDFQTLHYLYVTISFHLEICFWGQTHPTISDDVTNYTLFLFWRLPKKFLNKSGDYVMIITGLFIYIRMAPTLSLGYTQHSTDLPLSQQNDWDLTGKCFLY